MYNDINLMPAICSLVICIFIITANSKKNYGKDKAYFYFNFWAYVLFFNIICTLCRHCINNINIKYLFTLLHHSTNALVYYSSFMYCLALIPSVKNNISKYEKIFSIYYIFSISFILSSYFSHFVYFINDGVIEKGPFAGISFLNGYSSILIGLYFVVTRKASKKVICRIGFVALALFLPSFLELVFPSLLLNHFGCAFALLFIYDKFNTNDYDINYGISKNDLLIKKFDKLKTSKVNSTLFLVEFMNIENLSFEDSKLYHMYISDVFRNCEKLKFNLEIFSWNGKFVVFIKSNSSEDISSFIDSFDSFINFFHKDYYLKKLEYKILYIRNNNFIDSLDDLNNINFSEKIYEFGENDKKRLDYNKELLKHLKKIHSFNDFNDPRVEVFYQPIYDAQNKKFLSAEALTRINIKELGGIIFPDKFIPLLEKYNLIHKFSLIILNKVCLYIKKLEENNVEFEGISVNFSLMEFLEKNFENDILNIVRQNNVNPERIHIEITESIEAQNMELIKEKIMKLKEEGFKFYLDDFGTGYSNLSEIIEIPFDVIKFDRSLLVKSVKNDMAKDITFGMVNLFSSKNFTILFEGVEDESYESLALNFGSVFLQGYKYSRPIKAREAFEFFGKGLDFLKEKEKNN